MAAVWNLISANMGQKLWVWRPRWGLPLLSVSPHGKVWEVPVILWMPHTSKPSKPYIGPCKWSNIRKHSQQAQASTDSQGTWKADFGRCFPLQLNCLRLTDVSLSLRLLRHCFSDDHLDILVLTRLESLRENLSFRNHTGKGRVKTDGQMCKHSKQPGPFQPQVSF